MGTAGYADKAKVWQQEDEELASTNQSAKFSHILDPRTRAWVRARESSTTSSGITDDPDYVNAEDGEDVDGVDGANKQSETIYKKLVRHKKTSHHGFILFYLYIFIR